MQPRARQKAAKRGRPVRGPTVAVDMREHILDHAEALFAMHGLHGVTVRDVARSAAVDPALVHYYFENKQKLFDDVFDRRAQVVNDERMRSMDAYARAAGDRITVEGCVEAFLEPIWRHSIPGDPHWKNYFRMLALVNNTPEWGGRMMTRHFDPVIRQLIELIRRCMPGARDVDLYWCYHFLSGALTLSLSETGRIDRLSGGVCASSDMEAILRRMVPFIAAGFRSVCQSDPPID
jgi:AcrR family transcriptional regulator